MMSESQFEPGRVKFDQHLGPCVGDWYEMMAVGAVPSGRYFTLGGAEPQGSEGANLRERAKVDWSSIAQRDRLRGCLR